MSSKPAGAVARLSARLADHTQGLILQSAVELLEEGSVADLTVRAVAARAGISERTVFRYFATREEFLDAVAQAAAARMELPPDPASLADLLAYPRTLFARFEATAALTRAALHSDLFPRLRGAQAQKRWKAVRDIVDLHAPKRPEAERAVAAANIRYFLSATTWHYYRAYFGFNLEQTIAAAETAVRQAIEGLGRLPARERKP